MQVELKPRIINECKQCYTSLRHQHLRRKQNTREYQSRSDVNGKNNLQKKMKN